MKSSWKVGKIFGIDIKVHFSLFLVFALLIWALATGFFAYFYPEFSVTTLYILSTASALFLFLSVLLHELSHSIAAKSRNIKVSSITLFFFGGVATITEDDFKPLDEFIMAIAGPIFSLFLAFLFFAIFQLVNNLFINAMAFYLYQLNLILAIFNLVPAYPLDGGRVFRAILYAHYKNIRKATRIASNGGKLFAWILATAGLFQLFSGMSSGLWLIFLAIFLHFIAGLSYEQVVFKDVLSKWKVRDFMEKKFSVVKAELDFKTFLQQNIGNKNNAFLIAKKGKKKNIEGMLDMQRLGYTKPEIQNKLKLAQLAFPIQKMKFVNVNDNCYKAYLLLAKTGNTLLPVKASAKSKTVQGVVRYETLTQALLWNLKYGAEFKRKK
jgi:Zn-dependent protease